MTAAANLSKSPPPIPQELSQHLHFPKTPWHISPKLFERIKNEMTLQSAKSFVAVQVTNQDPEHAFIMRYFQHQKPPHYSIKNILCIHNPDQTKTFEGSFRGMEASAKAFSPGWDKEEPKAQRTQTIERWKASVAPFSPFQIPSTSRIDTYVQTKIVPLWHGSKHVESICDMGFTFFGKHHFFDKNAKAGDKASTDVGYFGSGIYFTNSPHYASMYHSGSLLLSWVSMREPYPVVNDVPIPKKGSDMIKLQGRGAYQTYNAHYIPVTSTDPKSPDNMIYHPCYHTELPAWDEYVVFEKSQALPRFIVELGVDLPIAPSNQPEMTVEALNDYLIALLDKPEIQSDTVVCAILTEKTEALFSLNPKSPLSPENFSFYNRTIKLLDPQGKIRPFIKQQLTQSAKQKSDAKEATSAQTKMTNHEPAIVAASVNSTSATANPIANIPQKTVCGGMNALHKAAQEGNVDLCKALLAGGADPLAVAENGWNAMFFALESEKVKVVNLLLTYKQLLESRNKRGSTPLIFAASKSLEIFEMLLKAGADPLAAQEESGWNAMHFAAQEKQIEIVKRLSTYKQLIESRNKLEETPFLIAAKSGALEICETLLKAGADPLATKKDGINAIHLATMQGKTEVVKLLSPYRELVNAKSEGNLTPLILALCSDNENQEICNILLKAGADQLAVDVDGWNTIHHASKNGKVEILKILLTHKQLINAPTKKGFTPFILASQEGHLEICKMLLKAGANPLAANEEGVNAMLSAAQEGKIAIIKLLLPYKQLINSKSNNTITPLIHAARKGYVEICEVLLKAGADPLLINTHFGFNAMHYAAICGKIEVVRMLLVYKQLIDSKDKLSCTPLMLAASEGYVGICEILLKAGASPLAVNSSGNNALQIALNAGKAEVVKFLSNHKK